MGNTFGHSMFSDSPFMSAILNPEIPVQRLALGNLHSESFSRWWQGISGDLRLFAERVYHPRNASGS